MHHWRVVTAVLLGNSCHNLQKFVPQGTSLTWSCASFIRLSLKMEFRPVKTSSKSFRTKRQKMEEDHDTRDTTLSQNHLFGDQVPMDWLHTCRVDKRRIRLLTPSINALPKKNGRCVVCILQRDMRVHDNWALLFSQDTALELKVPLHVVHLVLPGHTYARTLRHMDFHLRGVREVAAELKNLDISFNCLPVVASQDNAGIAAATTVLRETIADLEPCIVCCDFTPLRLPTQLMEKAAGLCSKARTPLFQVDAHNIVPAWLASDHQETAARTFRPRVLSFLKEFLHPYPSLTKHPHGPATSSIELDSIRNLIDRFKVDNAVGISTQFAPGTRAGLTALRRFLVANGLQRYVDRNTPTNDVQSNLSTWLHFGHISAQRCALEVDKFNVDKQASQAKEGKKSFLEQLVVRREVAENFVFYNSNYDKIKGAAEWARLTLFVHAEDKREWLYSREQFEAAETHDDLWNAAQLQLVRDAKMHGFLRMYWAKKILEWSESPEAALSVALYLNDKFSLDGTDPNGVVGIMWSIAGVHDHGFSEWRVTGKIRPMTYAGCRRKFDVSAFVSQYPGALINAKKAKAKSRNLI